MVEQIIAFVKAARSAKTFTDFLESGEAASLLSDIELNAAADAFRNLHITTDTRAQLWNAVNHLETAYHAAYSVAKHEASSIKNAILAHGIRRGELANKCELIACLLAVCYKLLGEDKLAVKYIDALSEFFNFKYVNDYGAKGLVIYPFVILTALPQVLVAGAAIAGRKERIYISVEQRDEIKKIIESGWGDA